jgi:SAM-dependent methyltransferase
MPRNKIWGKTDNSMEKEKALMRIKYLPKNAKVLDLFCGNGEMYRRAYKGRAAYYHGIDKNKIHDTELCEINNNAVYITRHNLGDFNTFDLDDYGSPWKQFYIIVKKVPPGDYTFFITDGLVMHQKVDGAITKFVSGTERIPEGFNVPGLNRFYIDIFGTMLKDLERRYNAIVRLAKYFHNERRSVYYWALKITKA